MEESRDIFDMIETIAGFLPEEVKKTGKPREYFEERMLERYWRGYLDDEQFLIVRAVVKAILDRTYMS